MAEIIVVDEQNPALSRITEFLHIHELDPYQQQKLLELLATSPPSDFALNFILTQGSVFGASYFMELSTNKHIYTRFGLFEKNGQDTEKETILSYATYNGFLSYCINDGQAAIDSINHLAGNGYHVFENDQIDIDQDQQEQIKSALTSVSIEIAQKCIEDPKYFLSNEELKQIDSIITAIMYLKVKTDIESKAKNIIDAPTATRNPILNYDK